MLKQLLLNILWKLFEILETINVVNIVNVFAVTLINVMTGSQTRSWGLHITAHFACLLCLTSISGLGVAPNELMS